MNIRKITYWPYIIVAYSALFILGLSDNLRGPFFPEIIESFQLNDIYASLIFAIPSFFAFVGSYISQSLVSQVGSLWSLRLGLLIMSIGFGGISQISNPSFLYVLCAVFGFGFGIVTVAEHLAIQEGASLSHRRRLFSGLHSMYALASLFAPLLTSFLIYLKGTWRTGFFSISLLGLLVLALSFLFQSIGSGEPELKEQTTFKERQESPSKFSLYYFAVFISFYLIGELMVTSRFVLFLRRNYEMSPETAPFYLASFFLLLLIGRLAFTFHSWKGLSNEVILKVGLASSTLLSLLGFYLSPVFLVFVGLAIAPIFGVAMDYISEVFKSKAPQAVALCMSLSALFVVTMHFGVGILTEKYGLLMAMNIGPASHAIAFLLFVYQPQHRLK